MVSFEIALSSKYFVYSQKKHRVVPYLQVTFLFLELKCDINQTVENILSLVLFSLHAVACSCMQFLMRQLLLTTSLLLPG